MKKINIGITGGEGFIGGHLRRFLTKQGHRISVLDKNKIDLVKPKESALKKFVSGQDIIIHAAGTNRGSDREIVAGNIIATFNLLAAMEKFHSSAKIIFLSSIQATLDNIYGQNKRLAEIMLADYAVKNKKSVLVLRLPNVFGENSQPFYNSVVATFCHQAANNKPLTVNPASRKKKIPLFYVEYLMNSINYEIKTMHKIGFRFKIFKPEKEISVGDLAKLITKIKNYKLSPKNSFERNLFWTFQSFKKK